MTRKSSIYALSKMNFLIVVALILIFTQTACSARGNNRKGKFWWIGVVRFENGVCNSTSNLDGTCYTKRQCRSIEGIQSGRCAQNIGVCCVIQRSCGSTSSYNNTYFVNTNFPNPINGATRCSMTIQKCNSDICQVRIDFLSQTLAQPNGEGQCVYDALTITGGGSQVPVLCGENSGQHVYVDFDGDNDITMTITASSGATIGRNWNLKVSQIACACPTKAPSGCLMYHTAQTGTVQSFNYGSTASSELNSQLNTGTRQLVNQNYGVCVAMIPGYCSIEWKQTQGNSFTVSNDTEAVSDFLGSPAAGIGGYNCTSDFVVIPHPYVNGTPLNYDRFCGNGLPPVTTFSKPFVLTVVNNGDEINGVANRGFSLDYTQRRCSSLTA